MSIEHENAKPECEFVCKMEACYKKSSVTIRVCRQENNWFFGISFLLKDSGVFHGKDWAASPKGEVYKDEYACKKAAIESVCKNIYEEKELKICEKLRSVLWKNACLGIDENSINKTLRALTLFKAQEKNDSVKIHKDQK